MPMASRLPASPTSLRCRTVKRRQAGRFFDLDVEPVMKVLVGRSEKKVQAAQEQFGWQEYATNWEDVIARNDIDIIDIGTPNDTHAQISVAALKAGKHVLCEKPL